MKKIILCIFLIFSLTGCALYKNEFDVGEPSNIEIVEKEVILSVKEGTLSKTGATFLLTNNSDTDIEYGNPYELEIIKDDKWHKIDVQIDFTLPAFVLKSGETKELKINWKNGYGKLAEGKYRIIKNIDVEKDDGTFDIFYVSAEFVID